METGIITDRSLRRGMYIAEFSGGHLVLFELLAMDPLEIGARIQIGSSHQCGTQDIIRLDRGEKTRICVENHGGTAHMLDPFR
jgi:hypothetical protein